MSDVWVIGDTHFGHDKTFTEFKDKKGIVGLAQATVDAVAAKKALRLTKP